MLANGTGTAAVRTGGDSWFFIVANFAFGHALERDTADAVRHAGGRVLGRAAHPAPGTTDFSSFLLQAQASRATQETRQPIPAAPAPAVTPSPHSARVDEACSIDCSCFVRCALASVAAHE